MSAVAKVKICKAAVVAFGVVGIAVAVAAKSAAALEFKDIAGKWCTAGGTEQFDPNNLIAIPTSSHERRIYPIVSYSYSGTNVTVVWKDEKGATAETVYSEFSADGQRMAQQASEKGPRRPFHRC